MRRSKLDPYEKQIREWVELGVKQRRIAQNVGCTEATLSLWLKRKRTEWNREEQHAQEEGCTTQTRNATSPV